MFGVLKKSSIHGQIKNIPPFNFPDCWLKVFCGHNTNPVYPWDFHYREGFSYEERKSYFEDVKALNTLYKDLPKKVQKVGVVNIPGIDGEFKIPGGFVISSGFFAGKKANGAGDDYAEKVDTNAFDSIFDLYGNKSCDFIVAFITGYARLLDAVYRLKTGGNIPGSEKHFENIHVYYKFLDKKIGELKDQLNDDTVLLILSAYGLASLKGRVNINEILVNSGDLCLEKKPEQILAFSDLKVDWEKTRCWSTGFNGAVFINLKGREPQGIVDKVEYNKMLDYIINLIGGIQKNQDVKVDFYGWKRNELYFDIGSASGPDLFMAFNGFSTSELYGHPGGAVTSHDLSPEGFNAVTNNPGYFYLYDPAVSYSKKLDGVNLEDFAPTVFEIFDILNCGHMTGESILSTVRKVKAVKKQSGATLFQSRLETLAKEEREGSGGQEHEEKIRSRLDALGY
ncbi:MAG: alkaline phosphatase family protein [Actinobacteria bacterium]|nr:alkaline phosphatase family protein [Actinomycetota bacterium]